MKNLFKNNSAIFKGAVGSVTDIFDLKKVEEDVYFVELRYLIRIIGQAQYDALIDAVYSGTMTEPYEKLVELLRPAIGRLVIVARIPEVSCSFNEGGILVKKTEDTVPASEYKVKALIRSHRNKAYEMLDHALEYLEAQTAVFTHYATSKERELRINGVVITPDQFKQAFGQTVSHVVFFMIQTFIRKIEREFLVNSIGEDFYNDLKTEAQNQASEVAISAGYARVLELAQNAVANLGMEQAIPVLAIRVDEDGLTVLDNSSSRQAPNNRKLAPDNSVSALISNCQAVGRANLKSLTDYLDKNASADLFANYFNSDYYQDPEATPEDWRDGVEGGYFGL